MIKINRQREKYLKALRDEVMPFWSKVVDQYNSGIPAREIAKMHINSKTNKNYSRQHIHSIIKKMSKLK